MVKGHQSFLAHTAAYCYEEEKGMDGGGVWQSSGYSSARFPDGGEGGVKGDCGGVVVMDIMSGEDGEVSAMESGLVVSKLREKPESIGDSEWLEAHIKFCTSGESVMMKMSSGTLPLALAPTPRLSGCSPLPERLWG